MSPLRYARSRHVLGPECWTTRREAARYWPGSDRSEKQYPGIEEPRFGMQSTWRHTIGYGRPVWQERSTAGGRQITIAYKVNLYFRQVRLLHGGRLREQKTGYVSWNDLLDCLDATKHRSFPVMPLTGWVPPAIRRVCGPKSVKFCKVV